MIEETYCMLVWCDQSYSSSYKSMKLVICFYFFLVIVPCFWHLRVGAALPELIGFLRFRWERKGASSIMMHPTALFDCLEWFLYHRSSDSKRINKGLKIKIRMAYCEFMAILLPSDLKWIHWRVLQSTILVLNVIFKFCPVGGSHCSLLFYFSRRVMWSVVKKVWGTDIHTISFTPIL